MIIWNTHLLLLLLPYLFSAISSDSVSFRNMFAGSAEGRWSDPTSRNVNEDYWCSLFSLHLFIHAVSHSQSLGCVQIQTCCCVPCMPVFGATPRTHSSLPLEPLEPIKGRFKTSWPLCVAVSGGQTPTPRRKHCRLMSVRLEKAGRSSRSAQTLEPKKLILQKRLQRALLSSLCDCCCFWSGCFHWSSVR